MIILINCANLRFGGAKTVGLNIINQLKQQWLGEGNSMIIVAPIDKEYDRFADPHIIIERIRPFYNKPWAKYILYNYKLPSLEKKYKPDFILSLGNIAFPSVSPQMVLLHIAFPLYPESIVWRRLSLKYKLYLKSMVYVIKSNIKYAHFLFVQTETMRNRASTHLKFGVENIGILPNGVSFTSIEHSQIESKRDKNKIKLLFLSKLYPHKNFDILIPIAIDIKNKELPITISITISEKDNSESKKFLEKIRKLELTNIIINIGHVGFERIGEIYSRHDGLLLPTLLESFSGTYIESFYFGKPVFTSDMDFAREVCGEAAYYFNPLDEKDILNTITKSFENCEEMKRKVELGAMLCKQSASWNDIGKDLIEFLNKQLTNS